MLLYHFTSKAALPGILRSGLCRGSVPIDEDHAVNAVWLTTRADPDGHGLEQGGAFLSEEQRLQAVEWRGVAPSPSARFEKDGSVRITVDLAAADRNLHGWLTWARFNVAPAMLARLHPIGSPSLHRAKSWRLYFGTIPRAAIVAVDHDQQKPGEALRVRSA
jgi:hypothetical protein